MAHMGNTSIERYSRHLLKPRNIPYIQVRNLDDILEIYTLGARLGKGAFGTVDLIIDKKTSKEWALKTSQKYLTREKIISVKREIEILKRIGHPHIIYLDKVFESKKCLYMVLEYCHGELGKTFDKKKPLDELIIKSIIYQLADAVSYLHRHDIVHRDIKMENILLGDNPTDPNDQFYVKLTDFGLSIVRSGYGIESMLHDVCGTSVYMAPEILTSCSYSQTCDNWSIGIILFILVYERYPFVGGDSSELIHAICTSEPNYDNATVSEELLDLLKGTLNKDTALRLTAKEISTHPWISNKEKPSSNILTIMKEWKQELMMESIDDTTNYKSDSPTKSSRRESKLLK